MPEHTVPPSPLPPLERTSMGTHTIGGDSRIRVEPAFRAVDHSGDQHKVIVEDAAGHPVLSFWLTAAGLDLLVEKLVEAGLSLLTPTTDGDR